MYSYHQIAIEFLFPGGDTELKISDLAPRPFKNEDDLLNINYFFVCFFFLPTKHTKTLLETLCLFMPL